MLFQASVSAPSFSGPHCKISRNGLQKGVHLKAQICQNSAKKHIQRAAPKKAPKSGRKGCKNGSPAPSKPSVSLERGCIFAVLRPLQRHLQNDLKIDSKITQKSFLIGAGGLPKAMPEISIKITTKQMFHYLLFVQTGSKIVSKKGLAKIMFLRLFGCFFSRCLRVGPRTPKIMKKYLPDLKFQGFL